MRGISPPLFFCAVLVIQAATGWNGWAGPTADMPESLLAVRPDPTSIELFELAAQIYPAAVKEVAQHEANVAARRYDKASKREMERIGATSLKVYQLRRIADRLDHLREPAGIDLKYRYNALAYRMGHAIGAIKQSENAVQLLQAAGTTMSALSARNKSSVTRITALVERDKLDAAERELDKIHDALYPPSVFLSQPEAARNFGPFNALIVEVQNKMKDRRRQLATEQLAAVRAEALPKYDAIAKLVTTAVEDARDDGQADWVGTALAGPELLDAWSDGWRRTRVKMLQCYALDRLREVPVRTQPPSDIDQLLAAHAKFEQQMLSAMVALIEADAARIDPGAAPQLYAEYLPVVAHLCVASADERVEQALAPVLEKLSQRSPDFARQVAAYEWATREALRWRRRTAAAFARRHQKDALAVSDLLIKASGDAALKNRPMKSDADVSRLVGAAPPLVQDVAQIALEQEAYAHDIAPQAAGPAVSRWEMYYFARVAASPVPAAEIDALKRDLLVSDASGPLTLEAAMAIASAQAGYLVAAGGEVSGVEMESLLVHWVRNDSTAHVPIGVAPDMSKATMTEVCWQVDLRPSWLQHEYLFFTAP